MRVGQPILFRNIYGEFCIKATIHDVIGPNVFMVWFDDGRGLHTAARHHFIVDDMEFPLFDRDGNDIGTTTFVTEE